MLPEKHCKNCKFSYMTEEYWHDHYLIQSHTLCRLHGTYHEHDVDPESVCEEHQYDEYFLKNN